MKTVTKLLITLVLISTSCSNKKAEIEPKSIGEPQIIHLQDTYSDTCFLFQNFKDNESCIKFLFNSINNIKGDFAIVTNRDGVVFNYYEAVFNYDKTDVFSFRKEKNKFEFISLRPVIRLKEYAFIKKENLDTVEYYGSFKNLDINILQNFITGSYNEMHEEDYINKRFELYNKDNIKKVVIVYHNYGEWFSIDIL